MRRHLSFLSKALLVPALLLILLLEISPALSPQGVLHASTHSPYITSISPTSGPTGTIVTVKGSYFGSYRGSSHVKFNTAKASTYSSWTSTQVRVKVSPEQRQAP